MGSINSKQNEPWLQCCAAPSSSNEKRVILRNPIDLGTHNCCGCENPQTNLAAFSRQKPAVTDEQSSAAHQTLKHQRKKEVHFNFPTDTQDLDGENFSSDKERMKTLIYESARITTRSSAWSEESQGFLGWSAGEQKCIDRVLRNIPGTSSDAHYRRQVRRQ
jgi:hypothetical protein